MKIKTIIAACAVTAVSALGLAVFSACQGGDCNHSYQENKCVNCGDVMLSEGLAFELNEDGASYKLTGYGAFEGKHVRVPESYNGKPVTTVGEFAFSFDDRIHTIVLPDTVTTIEHNALSGTDNLTDIRVPANITDVSGSFIAYSGYYNDAKNWKDGVLYLNATDGESKYLLYSDPKTMTPEVTVEKGTVMLAPYAFHFNDKLKKITMPDGLWKISDYAFQACIYLTEATMPDSVTYVGNYAFDNCEELLEMKLSKNATYLGMQCLANTFSLEKITFGNKITHIGKDAIGNSAFYNNEDNWDYLRNTFYIVSEDQSVKYLYCAGITTNYVIDDKTVLIGDNALTIIGQVPSLTIPKSVKHIGKQAFAIGAYDQETFEYGKIHSIVFENNSGWSVEGKQFTADELKNGETAAEYLQINYTDFEWAQK